MNVLIYAGPPVSAGGVQRALEAVRVVVRGNYTVQPVHLQAVLGQPWQESCKLLVLPGNDDGVEEGGWRPGVVGKVKAWVEGGGACLVFGRGCVGEGRGGLVGKSLVFGGEEEDGPMKFLDVKANRWINFDQGLCTLGAGPAGGVEVKGEGVRVRGVQMVRQREFKGLVGHTGAVALARYTGEDNQAESSIAALSIPLGSGKMAVWAPNIECPISPAEETGRLTLLAHTLTHLGLTLPPPNTQPDSFPYPLPQFLTSAPSQPHAIQHILRSLPLTPGVDHTSILQDTNDTFHFTPLRQGGAEQVQTARGAQPASADPTTWQPKSVMVCEGGSCPPRDLTPLFDVAGYFEALAEARAQRGLPDDNADGWGFGQVLLYGECVTSTQTMLDKNPTFLSALATPFLSLASHQLTGRGRGSNIWLSPAGCLQFSLLLRVDPVARVPAGKVVFVQYLFALAVVEACRDVGVLGGGAGSGVRVKWPNDIYVRVGEGEWRKVGGVLVNTSFGGGGVDVVIGCGLNVLNAPPIASLSQLTEKKLSMERTAAVILTIFETMWRQFIADRGSFESFRDLYLSRWLHSDQVVTLTSVSPEVKVRIVGITEDYGLLRTIREGSGEVLDLQPDGNSFDLMKGLIKMKG